MTKNKKNKKIVVIGGGTGTFTVLSELKKYPHDLTAIVSMADDGGSTGRLRDELGVLPPGDIRQCLVALSDPDLILRELFNYRFKSGDLKGHSFGNLFISAFEKITGNLNKALNEIENVLKIKGKVLPITLDKVRLRAKLENGTELSGENEINNSWLLSKFGIKKLFLKPQAKINKEAKKEILNADAIIIGPGNLYCSIIPNFLVKEAPLIIKKSKAVKIFNCNLMTKYGHTDNFTVKDFINQIEHYLEKNIFDYIIYNNKKPSKKFLKLYSDEGGWVRPNKHISKNPKFIGKNLLNPKIYKQTSADLIKRTLIRHDSGKLAKTIDSLLNGSYKNKS